MNSSSKNVFPVQANERFQLLDIVRGIALLGILLANMTAFSYPVIYAEFLDIKMWDGGVDAFVGNFIDWFVQGKFYTTFSFLFGVGFMIFLVKAEAYGYPPKRLFARRLTVLLGFGLLHALFIWWGDILVTYALCGYLLLLFYRCQARTLWIWVIALFSVGILQVSFFGLVVFISNSNFQMINDYVAYEAYYSGSWLTILGQNIQDWLLTLWNFMMYPFTILPMFLLGAYAYKRGIIQHPGQHLTWIRRVWLLSLVVGVVFSVMKYSCALIDNPLAYIGQHIGATVGDASLSICYMCSIVLLYLRGKARSLFKYFAMTGRMALTNYLTQSIICTFIYYHYGLGLYGLSISWSFIIAVLLFTAQVLFSRLWLMRYTWGPAEWLWRKLTYGRLS